MGLLKIVIGMIICLYIVWFTWFIVTLNSEQPNPRLTTVAVHQSLNRRSISTTPPGASVDQYPITKSWLDIMTNFGIARRNLLEILSRQSQRIERFPFNARRFAVNIRSRKDLKSTKNTSFASDFDGPTHPTLNATVTRRSEPSKASFLDNANFEVTDSGLNKSSIMLPKVLDNRSTHEFRFSTIVTHKMTENDGKRTKVDRQMKSVDDVHPVSVLILAVAYRWLNSTEVDNVLNGSSSGESGNSSDLRLLKVGMEQPDSTMYIDISNSTQPRAMVQMLDEYLNLLIWVLIGWSFLGTTLLLITVLAFARVKEQRPTKLSNGEVSDILIDEDSSKPEWEESQHWHFESSTNRCMFIQLRSPGSSCSSLVSLRSIIEDWTSDSELTDT